MNAKQVNQINSITGAQLSLFAMFDENPPTQALPAGRKKMGLPTPPSSGSASGEPRLSHLVDNRLLTMLTPWD